MSRDLDKTSPQLLPLPQIPVFGSTSADLAEATSWADFLEFYESEDALHDGDHQGTVSEEEDAEASRKRTRPTKALSERERELRKDRNREHAKRSRIRKKFLLETMQRNVQTLEVENAMLRKSIRDNFSAEEAEALLARCSAPPALLASDSSVATQMLNDPDFSFVKAMQISQQSFIITNPTLPDNPIVFASQGFMTLTGYTLQEVLGRNCRFLQGPATDPKAVADIRAGLEKGEDTSTVLLNYRKDETPFYNQLFIAPLRDEHQRIVNFLGVQCKVSEKFAQSFHEVQATST